MKILCCCAAGHVRSTTLAWTIKRLYPNHETLAVGIEGGNTYDTVILLSEWADRIIIVEARHADRIPPTHRSKVKLLDLGPDVWGQPWHWKLVKAIEKKLSELKL